MGYSIKFILCSLRLMTKNVSESWNLTVAIEYLNSWEMQI